MSVSFIRGVMKELIDKIVEEWSNRIPSGIIDLKNEEHKYHLMSVLNEIINDDVLVEEVMRNIYDNK